MPASLAVIDLVHRLSPCLRRSEPDDAHQSFVLDERTQQFGSHFRRVDVSVDQFQLHFAKVLIFFESQGSTASSAVTSLAREVIESIHHIPKAKSTAIKPKSADSMIYR